MKFLQLWVQIVHTIRSYRVFLCHRKKLGIYSLGYREPMNSIKHWNYKPGLHLTQMMLWQWRDLSRMVEKTLKIKGPIKQLLDLPGRED